MMPLAKKRVRALGPVSGSFFVFPAQMDDCTVKLLAKETKWTLLEDRTHPTFLEDLISKSDSGHVELLGLSRNGPKAS